MPTQKSLEASIGDEGEIEERRREEVTQTVE